MHPALAFLLFHLRVGARLALRSFVPLVSIVFALFFILRPEFSYSLLGAVYEGRSPVAGWPATLFTVSVATLSSRRICLGLSGWVRHLPAGRMAQRRTAGLAVFIAQLPALLILAGFGYGASLSFRVSPAPYLAGLPLLGLAAGHFALPVKRNLFSKPLAALACLGFSSSRWDLFFGGAVLLAAADFVSGPLALRRKRARFHEDFRGTSLVFALVWRALRLRLVGPYLVALPAFGATYLFISNNNPVPSLSLMAVRLGGSMAIVLCSASLSQILALRRPPWPWARSLPWSARRRIITDSFFIGLHCLPLLFMAGMMSFRALLPLLASLPALALYAALSIRQAPCSRTGGGGQIFLAGTLAAFLLCLTVWASLFYLALAPFILKQAVHFEKRQKVSRWLELHHLAAGDPLSWSAR